MYFYDELLHSDLIKWAKEFDGTGMILGYSNRIAYYQLRNDQYKFVTDLSLNGKLKDLKKIELTIIQHK